MKSQILEYLLTATLSWVPTKDIEHRKQIVSSLYEVVVENNESPLFEKDPYKIKTMIFELAIASYESGFNKYVDNGRITGDNGQSFCLMQIRVGPGRTQEGFTGKDLTTNRKKCFLSAHRILQVAKSKCPFLPPQDRFSIYATGKCMKGVRAAQSRYYRASAWIKEHPIPNLL